MKCKPERVLADLRALEGLTHGQRLAWTPGWMGAREWLRERAEELPGVVVSEDAAGNLWASLPGASSDFVLVGSHIDSVPDGGWLDGALGVLAGLELLRSRVGSSLPVGLRLVDFADEEGARFGRSLVGSTAATGRLDAEPELLAAARECGFTFEADRDRLAGALAYLELHIEQGPVLEGAGLSVCAVDGCAGVERHRVRVRGETAHAGAAPMDMRDDALVAAARGIVQLTEFARSLGAGTATVGRIEAAPGVPTIVPGAVELVVDLRHPSVDGLAALLDAARRAFDGEWERIWQIRPIPFDDELVALAREACGHEFTMTSGALHDAAALAPHVPAAMLFVPSKRGISHSREEDTAEADLVAGIEAIDRLLDQTIDASSGRPSNSG